MGKKWDTQKNFYDWCKLRGEALFRVIKPGGFVLIFGHPKTNHRMKCAFEDVGFNIVDEIEWIYSTGFPKNQDISKMIDKKLDNKELSNQWSGWKTAGLKPAHEPITIFQKPLKGTYINNIKNYNVGGMNIDDCRVPYKNEKDLNLVKAKCNFTENSKSIGFGTEDSIYGTGSTPLEQARDCVKEEGRFPANIIFDTYNGELLDKENNSNEGGASRFFLNIDYSQEELNLIPYIYCHKSGNKERGENNTHPTVKPKKLIKWLVKLITPKDGFTIDITAGSGTHGLCCEELNKEEGYNLTWLDIELLNTEKEPYCDISKKRLNTYLN